MTVGMMPELVDDLAPIETEGATSSNDPRVCVFTIHDGNKLPRRALRHGADDVVRRADIRRLYIRERDWGANLVAHHLVRALDIDHYLRVNLARVLVDYGRFPGVTRVDASHGGADYLHRKAIYPPMSELLSEASKHRLLTRYYDAISQHLTNSFARAHITLGVHTYDPRNTSGTERPEVSLVTRSLSYQTRNALPANIFDPLFPASLLENTGHKALTYRLMLDLTTSGRRATLNHPYVMPEGAVEIRAQVWFFFRFLRGRFLEAYPETLHQAPYQRIWQMLFDVTRRSLDCELLRGYLHRYREAPRGQDDLFAEARHAYAHVKRFLDDHHLLLVEGYRESPERPSCIGVEVRKDLLFEIDSARERVHKRPDADDVAREIAHLLAGAVRSHRDQVYPSNARAPYRPAPPTATARFDPIPVG